REWNVYRVSIFHFYRRRSQAAKSGSSTLRRFGAHLSGTGHGGMGSPQYDMIRRVLNVFRDANNFFTQAARLFVKNGPASGTLVVHVLRILVVIGHKNGILIARSSRSPQRHDIVLQPLLNVIRSPAGKVTADLDLSVERMTRVHHNT